MSESRKQAIERITKWADDVLVRFPTSSVGSEDEWYGVDNCVNVLWLAGNIKQVLALLESEQSDWQPTETMVEAQLNSRITSLRGKNKSLADLIDNQEEENERLKAENKTSQFCQIALEKISKRYIARSDQLQAELVAAKNIRKMDMAQIRRLQATLKEAEAELAKVKKVLKKCGRHTRDCFKVRTLGMMNHTTPEEANCTCGLEQVLKGE